MSLGILTGSDRITLVGKLAHLNETVSYISPEGVIVDVPAGYAFDGASIPAFAWSVVGHPYMPGYRRPSAVHDYLMEYRTVSSVVAHRYFHNCLLIEGVPKWKAKTLYFAVLLFGPRF
jgi:hypothetical protein